MAGVFRGSTASDSAAAHRTRGDGLVHGTALGDLIRNRADPLVSRPVAVDAAALVLGLVAAWLFRFTQDDAFISLRYARNLAEGHGLVFNIGQRVEGYTNFLWTLILSIPFHFGWDPVTFSHLVGLACFAATILGLRRLATWIFDDPLMAFVAVLVFITSHTVIVYGTGGGLEVQLQTALLTWALLVALRLRSHLIGPADDRAQGHGPGLVLDRAVVTACVVMSTLSGVALLTRLDSAVYLLVPVIVVLNSMWRASGRFDRSLFSAVLLLAVPVLLLVVPWLVWKVGYYGALLPNTLSAKSTPIWWALVRAAMYLAIYLVVTFQLLLVPMVLRHRKALVATPELRILMGLLGVWLAYLVLVGADFMEFRFLVVVMPAAAIMMTAVLAALDSRRMLVFAVCVLVIGSGVKWRLMPPAVFGIESSYALSSHGSGSLGWDRIGEILADAFPGGRGSPVSIAVTPAGYIPFYSRLPTIDMLGLNDPAVLEHACSLTKLKAGHEQIATPEYLASVNAGLVIGSVRVVDRDPSRTSYDMQDVRDIFLQCDLNRSDLPVDATIVEIPLSHDKILLALRLAPNAEVDRLITQRGWRELPVAQR